MFNTLKACCMHLPQRWIFALMGFLALSNSYSMRLCLSIAITEMTMPTNVTKEFIHDTCPASDDESVVNKSVFSAGNYVWSEYTQGLILSSFYWGYILTHVPGGILAEKIGGKYILGLGILSTSICTLLTPIVVSWGGSTALIILRVLMGFGEGPTVPAITVMLAQWAPPEERSVISSLVLNGVAFGSLIAMVSSGLILRYLSWPFVFYLLGTIGVTWFCFWSVLCYNSPREHPFISEKEAKYLHECLKSQTHEKAPPVPWRHIFTSVPFWALMAIQTGYGWGAATIDSDLPKYTRGVLKYSIEDNGYLNSLPHLTSWIFSIFTSWLADRAITSGHMSATNVRKLFSTIATVGPGIFIIGASYAKCDKVLVAALYSVGLTMRGCAFPGIRVNALDLSRNYAGTLMALSNGISSLAGVVAPCLIGVLTPDQTISEWRIVFWIAFGVYLAADIFFLLFGSGEVQQWNDPEFIRKEKEPKRHDGGEGGEITESHDIKGNSGDADMDGE